VPYTPRQTHRTTCVRPRIPHATAPAQSSLFCTARAPATIVAKPGPPAVDTALHPRAGFLRDEHPPTDTAVAEGVKSGRDHRPIPPLRSFPDNPVGERTRKAMGKKGDLWIGDLLYLSLR